MHSGTTTAEEFALLKVKEGLSQLILERKTCYGHRDRPGYRDPIGLKPDIYGYHDHPGHRNRYGYLLEFFGLKPGIVYKERVPR